MVQGYKQYNEYQLTDYDWLPEVPKHWEKKYLFQVNDEQSVSNRNILNQNLLSLSYGNIIKKDINSTKGLLPESFDTYQIVNNGNIILRLTDLQNDHKSLRVGLVTQTGIITSAYTCLKPKNVLSKYIYYLLHAFDLRKVFYGMGGGLRQSIGFKELRYFQLYIPPKSEQEQIIKFLNFKISKINKYIKKKKCEIELLKEQKQAEISFAVTKGLNPNAPMKDSGIEWLGEIPKHWNSSVFKRIFFRHDSGAWGDEQKNNSDDLICIRIADFDYERLRIKQHIEFTIRNYKEETLLNLRLENRDILIEKSGGGDKTPVGRTVIYDLEDSALFANFMDRLRVKENYSPYFVVYVFSVFYGTGIIRKYIKQTIGIQNLDINAYLSSEKIFFPDLKEQEEIVAYLNHRCQLIDKVIIATRKQIETLQEYKASLISAVVTGNVDIQDVHIDEIFKLETMDELDAEIEADELTKD